MANSARPSFVCSPPPARAHALAPPRSAGPARCSERKLTRAAALGAASRGVLRVLIFLPAAGGIELSTTSQATL